jgi:hypothetical protein
LLHETSPESCGAGLDRALHHPVGAENLYFMKQASAHATKACVEKDSKFSAVFDGPNSYCGCLRRVEAGGKP